MTLETPAHPQLLLANARQSLVRMEETIIFSLIERAQFRQNLEIYRRGAFPALTPCESLVGHLLRETECAHAAMRRYTCPDEHPFFDDLPPPRLPPLAYTGNPLRPNRININARVRAAYETEAIPRLCPAGDDSQYGSSAVCDVACLQALSRRVHFGMFVAESKRLQEPLRFAALLARTDDAELMAAITHPEVEEAVLERVRRKADTYLAELRQSSGTGAIPEAGALVEIYRGLIVPLNKQVQVAYLRATAEH
ncbi:MAG: chorismate mutase [Kiritimatiellae bacterium]|nr:chorismate mutase [Kiritimatiellia bacterium]